MNNQKEPLKISEINTALIKFIKIMLRGLGKYITLPKPISYNLRKSLNFAEDPPPDPKTQKYSWKYKFKFKEWGYVDDSGTYYILWSDNLPWVFLIRDFTSTGFTLTDC
ncbi:MAG: hypothetical protein V1794_10030 [Candidatus Glassbacteria bacterium]